MIKLPPKGVVLTFLTLICSIRSHRLPTVLECAVCSQAWAVAKKLAALDFRRTQRQEAELTHN